VVIVKLASADGTLRIQAAVISLLDQCRAVLINFTYECKAASSNGVSSHRHIIMGDDFYSGDHFSQLFSALAYILFYHITSVTGFDQ